MVGKFNYVIKEKSMSDILVGQVDLKFLIKNGFTFRKTDVNDGMYALRWFSEKFGDDNEYWLEFDLGQRLHGRKGNISYCWLNWNKGGGRDFVSIPHLDSIQSEYGFKNLLIALSGGNYQFKNRTNDEVKEIIEKHKGLFSLFGLMQGQEITPYVKIELVEELEKTK